MVTPEKEQKPKKLSQRVENENNPLFLSVCFVLETLAQPGVWEKIESHTPLAVTIKRAGKLWQINVFEEGQGEPLEMVKMIQLRDGTQTLTLVTKEIEAEGVKTEKIIGASYWDQKGSTLSHRAV